MLCLGEWCLRRDRRRDWEGIAVRVLPNLWDDRAAMHGAAELLDEFIERLLPALASALNAMHRVEHDVRYWRILAGPWLMHATHVYYDRWRHVQEALRLHPDLTTLLLDTTDHNHAVSSTDWEWLTTTDEFNLQLYSEVFAAMGSGFPTRRLQLPTSPRIPPRTIANVRRSAGRFVRSASSAVACAVPGGVLLHQALGYIAPRDVARLVVAGGFRVWPFEPAENEVTEAQHTDARRSRLADLPARDAFERFFVQRLSQMLPSALIEQYESLRLRARDGRRSSVVATFGGWYSSNGFRFTAAEAYARGARLVGVQHGGGYGFFPCAPSERHERRITDRFLAWGWGEPSMQPWVENAPAASLAPFDRIAASERAASCEDIVFIATTHPRYVYRFHSTPVSGQFEQYYDWQIRFFAALPPEMLQRIRFRDNPYCRHFGQGQVERLTPRFPQLKWDPPGTLLDSLQRTRLAVIDHNATSFLQVLRANVPSILYWNAAHWEIRKTAQEPFDALRRVGILYDDPESAAAATVRVAAMPNAWWRTPDVAAARSNFMERFAVVRDDWPSTWSRLFRGARRRTVEPPVLPSNGMS